MTRRRLPYAPGAALNPTVLFDGEVAWDTTGKRLRVGDGATPGGQLVPRMDDFNSRATTALDNVPGAVLIERSARTAPVNNLVAFLGDSITAASIANGAIAGVDTEPNAIRNTTRGMLFWLPFLTSQRFQSRQNLVFGVAGETAEQIAARVGQVVASGAGTCVVIAGTNNVGVNNYASTIAALDTIYRTLNAANILILAYPIVPRNIAGGANYGFMSRVNTWIEAAPSRYPNLRVMDPSLFTSPYDVTNSPKAGFAYDGLHPTGRGMRELARPAAAYLNTLLPLPPAPVRSVIDHVSASNPGGFCNKNPMLGGTDGTKGAGVTGSVATDWRVSVGVAGGTVGSLTVAASKGASSASGRETQKIVVGGSASGGWATAVILDQANFAGATFKAGDVVEAVAQIATAGGAAEIAGVALVLITTQGGVARYAYDGYPIVSDLWSDDKVAGTLKTPAMTLAQDDTQSSVSLMIFLRNTAATARGIELDVESIVVRKVAP